MQFAINQVTRHFGRDRLSPVLLGALLVLSGCSSSNTIPSTNEAIVDGADNPVEIPANPDDRGTVTRYRLTLNAIWSADTHSLNFPANPHFSGLVGAIHNEQVRFWEPAQIATPGIQSMAETGGKSGLLSEVQTAIDAGLALASISGGGIGTSPGSATVEFEVNRDYPQISITSMLAPSPDWFVGLHNYPLLVNGEFIESATIEARLYDSGSDNGERYTSANNAASPLAPIMATTSAPLDSPFINGEPFVGSFQIERLTEE
ncbi:MAG: spondin domain-containing protein [Granulosicoccus sp.]